MENSKQPAYPMINPKYDGNWDKEQMIGGLTKREYFAGLAMQGLLAGSSLDKEMTIIQMEYYTKNYPGKTNIECIVINSIELADELLKQLEN